MTNITIVTVINLLATIRPQYQELVLIKQLNNAFRFDHNIFLLHSSADLNQYAITTGPPDYTPKSLFVFDKRDANITTFEASGKI